MNNKIKLLLGTLLLLGAGQSFAGDTLLDHVLNACKDDLQQYCSQVTPGEGRLLYCVAAHEDKISGQCDYALYQAASLLDQLSAAIVYVAQSCENEIKTLCSDVQPGEGRILACLDKNDDKVGDTCKKAIADTVGE